MSSYTFFFFLLLSRLLYNYFSDRLHPFLSFTCPWFVAARDPKNLSLLAPNLPLIIIMIIIIFLRLFLFGGLPPWYYCINLGFGCHYFLCIANSFKLKINNIIKQEIAVCLLKLWNQTCNDHLQQKNFISIF